MGLKRPVFVSHRRCRARTADWVLVLASSVDQASGIKEREAPSPSSAQLTSTKLKLSSPKLSCAAVSYINHHLPPLRSCHPKQTHHSHSHSHSPLHQYASHHPTTFLPLPPPSQTDKNKKYKKKRLNSRSESDTNALAKSNHHSIYNNPNPVLIVDSVDSVGDRVCVSDASDMLCWYIWAR